MAAGEQEKDEGNEFADFMADISAEISERVGSLDEALPAPAPPVAKKRRATPASSDTGMILDWDNIVDRMIEEMI